MIFFLHNVHNTLRNSFLFLIIYLKSDTNGQLSTRCYINDKRDFNFPIIYFPHLDSNITSAPVSDMSVCICIDNEDTYIQLNYNDCGYLSIQFQISVAQIKTRMNFITSKVLRSPPSLGWPSWNICVTNDHGDVPLVVNTSRSFPHSWLVTGFVTRLTRRMPLVEQELPTLPEHLSSPQVFSGARVTRSLV
jgi:hypothetical protein